MFADARQGRLSSTRLRRTIFIRLFDLSFIDQAWKKSSPVAREQESQKPASPQKRPTRQKKALQVSLRCNPISTYTFIIAARGAFSKQARAALMTTRMNKLGAEDVKALDTAFRLAEAWTSVL